MATVGALLLKALIPFFFLGLVGAAITIVISFAEDMTELFQEDD